MIVWDEPGTKRYETGVDRGVFYPSPSSAGIAWNGLLSVSEEFNNDVEPIYYDGMKVTDFLVPGDFAASMTAYTYPDEFLPFEGIGLVNHGVHVGNQAPKPFCLSYRTMVGDDLAGNSASYKLHILYNVTAVPSDKSYETMSDDTEPVEFEWSLTTVPYDLTDFVPLASPSAHLIISSDDVDPDLLEEVEDMLYSGTLLRMDLLIQYMDTYVKIRIDDNGDGTWTAEEHDNTDYITMISPTEFQIDEANAVYLDADTFEIQNKY